MFNNLKFTEMPKIESRLENTLCFVCQKNTQEYFKPRHIHEFKFSRLHLSLTGNFLLAKYFPHQMLVSLRNN